MHALKHKLYLLEQHSDTFDIWSAIYIGLTLRVLEYEIGPRCSKSNATNQYTELLNNS